MVPARACSTVSAVVQWNVLGEEGGPHVDLIHYSGSVSARCPATD